ncbi:MAG: hypothetical protein WBN80_12585 [Prochlorococcaceae cyanobacterium]
MGWVGVSMLVRWSWMLAVLLWLSGLFWAAWCRPATLLGWPLVGDRAVLSNALVYGAYALQLLVILNLERGQLHWKGRTFSTR